MAKKRRRDDDDDERGSKKKRKKSKSGSWEKRLASEAKEEQARETAKGGGNNNKVSIKNSRFTRGSENFGRELDVIVIDFCYVNQWYKKAYNANKPTPPQCFALSKDGKEMEPHDNSSKSQSDECESCPWNEWSSGKGAKANSRAKACKQGRKIAFIDAEMAESPEDISDADIYQIEMPPTSVGNWGAYVKDCTNKLKRPFSSVITKLSFGSNQSYPVLEFDVVEEIDDEEIFDAINDRKKEALKLIMTPLDDGGKEDEDAEDDEDEDDDDDEDSRSSRRSNKRRKSRDDDDEDDDEDEDDDDDEEDEDEDEDDDDEEDDEDDDEDDDDEPRSRKSSKRSKGNRNKSRSSRANRDDDDDDDDDDEDDERGSRSRKGGKKDGAKRRKGSRFGK